MPGLVPGIHVFYRPCSQDVDGRDKPGHDAGILVMHDIKWIRENAHAFDAALKRRGLEPLSSSLLAIDERRRAAILKSEQAQARRNSASKEVPDGADEHGNVVRHHFGAVRHYAFAPKPHDDLGGALGLMDFEAAAKLSGARFVVLKKGLARLDRAIGQFMLDLHTNEHG